MWVVGTDDLLGLPPAPETARFRSPRVRRSVSVATVRCCWLTARHA